MEFLCSNIPTIFCC